MTGVPSTFYGLNAQALWGQPASEWDAQLSKLAATGVGTVRFDAFWAAAEWNPPLNGVHIYNWAYNDQIVAALARHRLQALPIIDYGTIWASSDPASLNPTYAPPDPGSYAAYARAFAQRYGPGGAFWAANPQLPQMPINRFEIWNEENGTYFFEGADPTVYATLYADAWASIHSMVPGATVMVGGLVPWDNSLSWLSTFISALPQHGREIDAVGWHPYYTNTSGVYSSLYWLHQELAVHGLNPPIELTEVNDPVQQSQPAFLSELARTLPGLDCNVTAMIVHTWTPNPSDPPSEQAFAIADQNGDLNPAGNAYTSSLQAAEGETPSPPPAICEQSGALPRVPGS